MAHLLHEGFVSSHCKHVGQYDAYGIGVDVDMYFDPSQLAIAASLARLCVRLTRPILVIHVISRLSTCFSDRRSSNMERS